MAGPAVSFAVLLRTLRANAGLTQEELAAAAHLSYRSISDLERGVNHTARRETTRLLADALNLTGVDREAFETAARGRVPANRSSIPAGSGTIAAATRTLPRDIATFTGRESEFRSLLKIAAHTASSRGTVTICAIEGMAGIGKTALAVHVAHQLAARFPDGQVFLPLHGHTPGQHPIDPADALASLLQTAGVAVQQIPGGLEERARLWRDFLAGKRLLLLLDDAAGHEQVRPLLPGSGGSLVLVTSRRHLTALEDAQLVSLDTLSPDEAGRLLARLAVRPGLDPEARSVREIARMCGYLPLAIGMLGRQLHHHPAWSAAGLAAELAAARSRLELMHAENLSVTTAFDLSYQDLAPDQQRLFRRLGLHPGTDADQYAAAALDDIDLATARRRLQALYDHYLLAEPASGRYRFHDLIGEHARTLALTDPPAERDEAVDRLLCYYLHAARAGSHHLARRTPGDIAVAVTSPPAHVPDLSDRKTAVAWMDAERVNLHTAAVYAAASSRPSYAIAIPAAIHGYLRHQGHWDQILVLHHIALDVARRNGDRSAEANALTDLGDVQFLDGNYPAAADSLTLALKLHRGQGDKHGEAHALGILGYVQHLTGNNQSASANLVSAVDLYRMQSDLLGEAATLAYLGYTYLATGDYVAAEASLTRALEIQSSTGNTGEAGSLNYLGVIQTATGNYAAATANQIRALELYRDLGNRLGEATALRDLGLVQQATGEYSAAIDTLSSALQLHRDLGSRRGEARTLHYLSIAQRLTGDYPAAAASLAAALDAHRDGGDILGEAEVLNAAGELALACGNLAEAHDQHQQALGIATAIASPLEEAHALEGIGRCQLQNSQDDDAFASLQKAMTIYVTIGSPNASRIQALIHDNDL